MQSSVELRINEDVVAVVRKSILCEFLRFIMAIVFLLIPFFFFFPLLKLGVFGFILFVLMESFAILFSSKLFVSWYYSLLIITNERVIDINQQGLFKREIEELELRDIKDCIIKKPGALGRLFSLATIVIKTKKPHEFDISFGCIKKSSKVKELITDVLGK